MKKTKSIAIVAAMTTLLSATAVYANTTSSSAVQIPKFSHSQSGPAHGGSKADLNSLVTAGTITQAQADAVQSALKPAKLAEPSNHTSIWASLVTAGTITQAQADAIKSAQEAAKPAGPAKIWEGLVTAGTITQAQADAILGTITNRKMPFSR